MASIIIPKAKQGDCDYRPVLYSLYQHLRPRRGENRIRARGKKITITRRGTSL